MVKKDTSKQAEVVLRSYVKTDPKGAARSLESLKAEEAAQLIIDYPIRLIVTLFEHLIPHFSAEMLPFLNLESQAEIIEALTNRRAIRILRYLTDETRQRIMEQIDGKLAKHLQLLIEYPQDTAGGIMDTQFVSILFSSTVQKAIQTIRKSTQKNIGYLYAIDENGILLGVVSIRDLLLSKSKELIEPLINRTIQKIHANSSREELVAIIEDSRFLSLPVIDDDGHLLGVIRHDQVVRTIQKDILGDMTKMVGSASEEHSMAPVSIVVKRRLPWLIVNLFTAFIAAAVVGMFEGIIAKVTALAVLLPIVAGQGGNTGAQSLAIVIRGLALREILPTMVPRLLIKEIIAAAINGLVIAFVTAAAVLLWSRSWILTIVIGLSMVVNMVAAALAGASIPLILKKLGRDPAQSSSIFMTTITDVVGFASFLGFAMILFSFFT